MNDMTEMHTLDATAAPAGLDAAVARATDALLAAQQADGHWVYELEADSTIPAEYVLLVHYLGEAPNVELEQKIARYLRRIQQPDGGWPLFTDGAPNISASVKAYFALKVIGDDENAEHMQRARRAIHAMGGAEMSNVFTRIQLALYGVVPWYAVPMMPVEIMLLPQWFPFHLSKVSYWARTVIVPLLVLNAKRPVAKNPRGVRIDELFKGAPVSTGLLPKQPHQSAGWFAFFRAVDGVLRLVDGLFPRYTRERAIRQAVAFVDERLNGEDGLGAIYPAMANAVMMYAALGYPEDHPNRAIARRSIEKLLVVGEQEAYCQPCLSPVWDTSLAAHALLETGDARARDQGKRIVLTRPAVEAGERLGFLPGDLAQKVDPYLRPLYDALYDLLGFDKTAKMFERQMIEIAPLAYMRGRTLNHAFIILDEAQNTTPEQMKMFLTRIGFGSKAVVTGDTSQVDLPRGHKSGLVEAQQVLGGVRGIALTRFTSADVVRHPLVARIVEAYDEFHAQHKDE